MGADGPAEAQRRTLKLMEYFLCHYADLGDGTARGFDPLGNGSDFLFLVRRGEQIYGYYDECPHYAGARMAWRRHAYLDASGGFIACHGHGAKFDIATGEGVAGACLGQFLQTVALRFDISGQIFAELESR